ncbi:MAG: hypothetical protein KY475_09620 [Planctomycetes bacterium]|nr:hypothetical protein [Planctomycetota bacterium]
MQRTVLATLAAGIIYAALSMQSLPAAAGDWGFSFGFASPGAHFDYHHHGWGRHHGYHRHVFHAPPIPPCYAPPIPPCYAAPCFAPPAYFPRHAHIHHYHW